MALFGLSPLCLSVLASNFFTEPASGHLNVVLFLKFMATLTTFTHVLSYFILQAPPRPYVVAPMSDHSDSDNIDENSTLVSRITGNYGIEPSDNGVVESPHPLRDWSFWLLGLYCFLIIGAVSVA